MRGWEGEGVEAVGVIGRKMFHAKALRRKEDTFQTEPLPAEFTYDRIIGSGKALVKVRKICPHGSCTRERINGRLGGSRWICQPAPVHYSLLLDGSRFPPRRMGRRS